MKTTRYPILSYQKDGPNCWSFYMIEKGEKPASIGPKYTKEKELLADVKRFYTERFLTNWLKPEKLEGKLSYERWEELFYDQANIEFAESGADREMSFNLENELLRLYERYCKYFKLYNKYCTIHTH